MTSTHLQRQKRDEALRYHLVDPTKHWNVIFLQENVRKKLHSHGKKPSTVYTPTVLLSSPLAFNWLSDSVPPCVLQRAESQNCKFPSEHRGIWDSYQGHIVTSVVICNPRVPVFQLRGEPPAHGKLKRNHETPRTKASLLRHGPPQNKKQIPAGQCPKSPNHTKTRNKSGVARVTEMNWSLPQVGGGGGRWSEAVEMAQRMQSLKESLLKKKERYIP